MLRWGLIARQALRYAWAAPNSVLGLALVPAALAGGGGARVLRGVLEVYGGAVAWLLARAPLPGGASALTLGHVVLGRSPTALDAAREHEHVHVRQYELWGPLFIPAYLLASAWLMIRGRDRYHENPFERQAFRAAPRD